ncbi:MAG: LysM peptidoglycan-binding domain-containing protein, partial [Oscillospiraceae bacterium]|nr:LysM peptidoglycan-binding domain-containing protein [Oscillospiraceae bacterium]
GNMRTLNFTYMGAGCTSDAEYTGPGKGSASIFNKGLIVTINADKTLDFVYYTLDGQKMYVEDNWLVRFRTGFDNFDVINTQYIPEGGTPAPVQAPEREGYVFDGWVTWNDYAEVPFDFNAPVDHAYLVTAKYLKILTPLAAPDAADCVTVTPDATYNGTSLTMTAAGVGDLYTSFDLASIGYGTGIEYGFWFDPDGVVSFNQDATLYYQGAATDFTLKAGEFYSVEGFGEHYLRLDDGNMLLLLEKAAPGNFASLPGTQPFSAFPGKAGPAAPAAPAAEPEPAPAAEPVGQVYIVMPGDTLWGIARRFYGTGFRWGDIYYANTDVIRNPRMIYVGQTLLIP